MSEAHLYVRGLLCTLPTGNNFAVRDEDPTGLNYMAPSYFLFCAKPISGLPRNNNQESRRFSSARICYLIHILYVKED